ncbi:hypothetical protein TRFO_37994 [Tritrichomonas foetus]|uniref:DUF3447 domain-containing protein n=1 Tax=Tritrichomonas foetus TaxID=1144522 RepID=A0A1J4JAZ9_9EUKA|nr:hypothetical protein TRFO_37994 [Tritrichomonas foetus]|eukprot:OHS95841.1 hypothetical protein TRFO_37994 [Tritrichomonas foetus]
MSSFLCKKYSFKFDIYLKSGESELDASYDCENDEFVLINNLFNYKRVFLTSNNIDFLEYSADFLGIPKLTKKVKKFREQYHLTVENPILTDLQNIQQKLFNIENEDDIIEFSILYSDIKYAASISHLLLSAFFSRPIKTDLYLKLLTQNTFMNNLKICSKNKSNNETKNEDFIDCFKKIISHQRARKSRFIDYLYHLYNENENLMNLNYRLNKKIDAYFPYDFNKSYPDEIVDFFLIDDPIKEIIKNDEIDAFQSYLSSSNIDINHKLFNPIGSFINFSAFYSSIKIFKFLFLNNATINQRTFDFAAAGGNIEIVHLCQQKLNLSFASIINYTIMFHRHELFEWIVSNHTKLLSLRNSCCTKTIFENQYITQEFIKCKQCQSNQFECCCYYCSKRCHYDHIINKNDLPDNPSDSNNGNYGYRPKVKIGLCFCDDDCHISDELLFEERKTFIAVDNLVSHCIAHSSIYALNVLLDNGMQLSKCWHYPPAHAILLKNYLLGNLLIHLSSLNPYINASFTLDTLIEYPILFAIGGNKYLRNYPAVKKQIDKAWPERDRILNHPLS